MSHVTTESIVVRSNTIWNIFCREGIWHAMEPFEWAASRWFVLGRCSRTTALAQAARLPGRQCRCEYCQNHRSHLRGAEIPYWLPSAIEQTGPSETHVMLYTHFRPFVEEVSVAEYWTNKVITAFATHLLNEQQVALNLVVGLITEMLVIQRHPDMMANGKRPRMPQ